MAYATHADARADIESRASKATLLAELLAVLPAGATLVLATDDQAVADANPQYTWLITTAGP